MKTAAIILAAGQGKRMKQEIPKQYIKIHNKPMLYYSIKAFEKSSVDEIILVAGTQELNYIRKEFIKKYGFRKIAAVTEGGVNRCDSVYQGLKQAEGADYVLIHDGARPCITTDIIEKAKNAAIKYGNCIVGMPIKDTIKIVNEKRFVTETPERSKVWITQTPQAFSYDRIRKAYDMLFDLEEPITVTDDAMVLERMLKESVYMKKGSYENIKITTPEDLKIARLFLQVSKK